MVDPRYKNALPSTARELVDRIEQFAGLPIQVVVDPSVKVSPTDPNPTRAAAAVTEDWALITLPTPRFEPNGIVHELLHIESFWIEGVPQIIPIDQNDTDKWNITSFIENSLEHLIIVPREVQYGFDPYPYWAKTDRALWERYPWPEMTNAFARRKNALIGSLGVFNLTKDESVIALARGALEKEGLLKEALRFNKHMINVLHSKEKMLKLAVEYLGVPKNEARLIYLDVRSRRSRLEAIP